MSITFLSYPTQICLQKDIFVYNIVIEIMKEVKTMTKYGDILFTLRKQKKISQDELARNAGVTKSTISKYERGEIMPSLDIANDIASYFGVTVDSMTGEGINETGQVITEKSFKEVSGLPKDYLRAIKLAFNNKITPDELINLINVATSIKNNK
jgi:transcriptional regulator with XRE-family HTH domain